MNRYPWWKYAIIAIALVVGLVYAAPNFFGEAPAVQVSSAKSVATVDDAVTSRVQQALADAHLQPDLLQVEDGSIHARFDTTDNQLRARDAIDRALNPDPSDPSYVVALNLQSRSPQWLTALNAHPMYLGLDLRGGVHFLLQVDVQTALVKKVDSMVGDVRAALRDRNVTVASVARQGNAIEIAAPAAALAAARGAIADAVPDLQLADATGTAGPVLRATLRSQAAALVQELAIKQNITTLHNRINELGVAEPIIQQQGMDRIVVELPGVQDTARAKELLGRTATLEVRMVDDSPEAQAALAGTGAAPFADERFQDREGQSLLVNREVLLTGENLSDAQPGRDNQTQEPAVFLTLDSRGARIFRDVTRENVGKRMAILLFEKGKGEVVTAPVIRTEIAGGRVQISGAMSAKEAADTALLLRSGSLAAPMDIIEERTIGPSLGADNIRRGVDSLIYGFVAIVAFMCFYYMFFGVISSIALVVNLLLLVALLSMLQATLTLPGIAAMALALGMAIDSNVLINERIREELREGAAPQTAIHAGYDRAWNTIIDSNITTLIAGLALLAFGSGPVRGFAVVHCLGILTSMFSAVFFSRGLVNWWYGGRRKLKKLSIGQIWKPTQD